MVFEDAIDFAANLSLGRGLLGLDPGTKTIGVALSDRLRLVASAHETIQRRKFSLDAARLSEIFAAR
ncbi:MAG: Holliday junction resolvase RuvX, partial [Pseudomonadota bacterium]